jgi:NADPH:quinone reductase-like Zn-dependent oxidoreductase
VNAILPVATPLFRTRGVVVSPPWIDRSTVVRLAGLMESGAFRPVIDRSCALGEIAEAHRYVETGQKIGNVVITVAGSSAY